VFAAGGALSAWQGGLTRESTAAHWSVILVVVGSLVALVALGRGRQRQTSRAWAAAGLRAVGTWRRQPAPVVLSVVVWSVLFGAVVGWDLVSFIGQSHSLPTLSYYIGHVSRYAVGRGALFALWLGLGAYLVAGGRAPSGRP
jgi:hypothetical protein